MWNCRTTFWICSSNARALVGKNRSSLFRCVLFGLLCGQFGKKETLEFSMKNLPLFLICGIRFCFGGLFGSRMCVILETPHYLICLGGGVFYSNRGSSHYRYFGFGFLCILYLVCM